MYLHFFQNSSKTPVFQAKNFSILYIAILKKQIYTELVNKIKTTTRRFNMMTQNEKFITKEKMQEYLVLPKQIEGYFDIYDIPTVQDKLLLHHIEFMMAQFCVEINRVFLIAAYGWSKKQSKVARSHFFHIFNNYGICIDTSFNHLAFDCDFNQKLPIDRNLILEGIPFMSSTREMAMNCRETTLSALGEWATKELDFYLPYESTFYSYDDICTCRALYCSYVDFALKQLKTCWFDEIATFIAYPFCCEEYFEHIEVADDDQLLDEIDHNAQLMPMDDNDENDFDLNATSPLPTFEILPAIHMPSLTKKTVYYSNGTIQIVQFLSFEDSEFPTILTEDVDDSLIFSDLEESAPSSHFSPLMESLDILNDHFASFEDEDDFDLDLSDMDLYVDSDEDNSISDEELLKKTKDLLNL